MSLLYSTYMRRRVTRGLPRTSPRNKHSRQFFSPFFRYLRHYAEFPRVSPPRFSHNIAAHRAKCALLRTCYPRLTESSRFFEICGSIIVQVNVQAVNPVITQKKFQSWFFIGKSFALRGRRNIFDLFSILLISSKFNFNLKFNQVL